jgi:PAS domain S-box-containing protein
MKAINHTQSHPAHANHLKKSRDFLESIFDMTGDGIFVTDDLGYIVMANRTLCDMTGYTEEELLGKYGADLICQAEQGPAAGKAVVQEGVALDYDTIFQEFYNTRTENYEAFYQRRDGHVFPVGLRITNLQNIGGLSSAIIVCVRDISEIKHFEAQLKAASSALEKKVRERTSSLEEANTALRVLVRGRDEDRVALEEKMVANINELVMPYIAKLKNAGMNETQKMHLEVIESNLNDIISPFIRSTKYFSLTPAEIQIANLIKHGKNTKEVAQLLNISTRTVDGHRDRIRKKLGLSKRKINLRTHLISLE